VGSGGTMTWRERTSVATRGFEHGPQRGPPLSQVGLVREKCVERAGFGEVADRATIQPRALTQLPWLLGTFRGTGTDGTVQAAFFERYSLADDSTLIVESFKDSTLSGAIDTTRYEARRDSLTNPGSSRYVATSLTPDSIVFGPLVGVKNGFLWRKGDSTAWTAVIIPQPGTGRSPRFYRMARIR